jgi:hypothetical protein
MPRPEDEKERKVIENLDLEAEKINKEIEDEAQQELNLNPDEKTDPDPDMGKKPEADPEGEDEGEKEENEEVPLDETQKPEKTLITDDLRKQLNIPGKFKYIEDYTRWGKEAEKANSYAQSELNRVKRDQEERDRKLAYLEGQIAQMNKPAGMDDEEKERIAEAFREDFDKDPQGAMMKVIEAYDKKRQEKEHKKQQEHVKNQLSEQNMKEQKKILDEIGEDKFYNEVLPALDKIAKEKPYLTTVNEAYAIYLLDKQEFNKQIKEDGERKRKIKKKSFSETGYPKPTDESDPMDKISNANSIEELDKAME